MTNKEIIERYPFYAPIDLYARIIPPEEHKYEYTLLDDVPTGWHDLMLILGEELRKELIKINYLDKFHIIQAKEKFGQLRIYHDGVPSGSNIDDIIGNYSVLSENVCMACGKPDSPQFTRGWISCYCKDCYCKIRSPKEWDIDYNYSMQKVMVPSRSYRYWASDSNEPTTVTIPLTEQARKIREVYETKQYLF